MISNRFRLLLPWLFAGFAMLSGCTTPAVSKSMVVWDVQFANVFPYSVTVRTQGGKELHVLDKPKIFNQAFDQAIMESLEKSGPFAKIIGGKDADYLLNVWTIFEVVQPVFASFTVTMKSVWSLVQGGGDSRKVLMRESIQSSSTATIGDTLIGATRLRLATEGAVQENIRLGIKKLSKLSL